MSTVVYSVIASIIAVYTLLGICIHCVNRRRPLERDQVIAAARDSYQGPDSLRLMQDLDAHLDDYAEHLSGLYEPAGPPPSPDPMWDPGRERLWDAIRDTNHHTKGDS